MPSTQKGEQTDPKKFSGNNRKDPGDVPEEFKGFTQAKEMHVAVANTIMRVFQLYGGQLGYRGHVVNVSRDVVAFAAALPRLGLKIPLLVVRRPRAEEGTQQDINVRKKVATRALRWLKWANIRQRTHANDSYKYLKRVFVAVDILFCLITTRSMETEARLTRPGTAAGRLHSKLPIFARRRIEYTGAHPPQERVVSRSLPCGAKY